MAKSKRRRISGTTGCLEEKVDGIRYTADGKSLSHQHFNFGYRQLFEQL